jgi:hypothetical protein
MERMGTKSATIAADINQFDHDDLHDDMERTAPESATIVAENTKICLLWLCVLQH